MGKRAKIRLVMLLTGIVMVIVGVALFLSQANMFSDFLTDGGKWTWWQRLLVLLPLVVGIVMSAVKPKLLASKIIAAVGAIGLIVVIIASTTIVIEKNIPVGKWIACGVLIIGGCASMISALFIKGKK